MKIKEQQNATPKLQTRGSIYSPLVKICSYLLEVSPIDFKWTYFPVSIFRISGQGLISSVIGLRIEFSVDFISIVHPSKSGHPI